MFWKPELTVIRIGAIVVCHIRHKLMQSTITFKFLKREKFYCLQYYFIVNGHICICRTSWFPKRGFENGTMNNNILVNKYKISRFRKRGQNSTQEINKRKKKTSLKLDQWSKDVAPGRNRVRTFAQSTNLNLWKWELWAASVTWLVSAVFYSTRTHIIQGCKKIKRRQPEYRWQFLRSVLLSACLPLSGMFTMMSNHYIIVIIICFHIMNTFIFYMTKSNTDLFLAQLMSLLDIPCTSRMTSLIGLH